MMHSPKNRKRNPNKKRKQARRKKASRSSVVKTWAAAIILIGLSVFGLWRCLDDDGGSPLKPFEKEAKKRVVDVGKGKKVDPTLLSEQKLLKAEMPQKEEKNKEKIKEEDNPEQEPDEPPKKEEPEERYALHAVAFHFHTQVLSEPSHDSRVVGYARRGSTFRVSERVSKKGCKNGWHEIAPGGLFICASKGVIVSDEPVTFAPSPPPPNINATLPYRYAYAQKDNTPQYWRVPTPLESNQVLELFDRIEAKKEEASPLSQHDKDSLAKVLDKAAALSGAQDSKDAGTDKTPPKPDVKKAETPTLAKDGGVVDPYALPPFVHARMAKGYYVSTDDTVKHEKVTYRRTVRGRYIPEDRLVLAKPSTFEGILLGRQESLPQVYVVGGGVKFLRQEKEGSAMKTGDRVARLFKLPFLGEMKRRNRHYVQVGENLFLSSRVAAVLQKVAPPDNLKPDERWIDIDLGEQTLVAYEGENPVFATLVSTGREGFETPEGSFRIYSKHITITMDDPDAGEEAYSIEDVPWTQYFEEGYALHAAFWHNRFGRVRSHGCINLSPVDARRLFFWTGPHLPDGIHGLVATRSNPGTRVVIHK